MTKRPTPVLNLIGPDGRRHPVKLLTPSRHKAIYRPYSAEIGHLATSWNQLHHYLSAVFATILRAGHQYYALAVWYSTDNDFAQRKMLRSVIQIDEGLEPAQRFLKPYQSKDLLWLLNQIDDKLRHDRNNAMHAPLVTMAGLKDGRVRYRVEAIFSALNPRARSLHGKNLLQEFRVYAAHAKGLAHYASQIYLTLRTSDELHPWPDKPRSPQAHNKKRKTRRARAQLPPRPPAASQA